MTRVPLLSLLIASLAASGAARAGVDLIAAATIDGEFHDLAI